MDQAMQQLLWVMKTMPQDKVIQFILDIFMWMDNAWQTELISKISESVWLWTENMWAWNESVNKEWVWLPPEWPVMEDAMTPDLSWVF